MAYVEMDFPLEPTEFLVFDKSQQVIEPRHFRGTLAAAKAKGRVCAAFEIISPGPVEGN